MGAQTNAMKMKEIVKRARRVVEPFQITKGKDFRLKDVDPGDTLEFTGEDKPRAKEALANGVEALAHYQEMLYANDKRALLLIFQAMDAAGKDGAIKHVLSGVNPQGCDVHSFKAPTSDDLDHDYLWRSMKVLPNRGHLGIFNRSYYEEVLVVRVHPEFLAKQKLPPELITKNVWQERFEDILRAIPRAQRRGDPQVLPAPVEERAEAALHGAAGQPGQALEVFFFGHGRARVLGSIHGGLRGHDPPHGDQVRSVVCGAGG